MKKHFSIVMLVTFLAAVFCLTGCSAQKGNDSKAKLEPTKEATTYPLSIEDDLGNTVTFDAAPAKVVSLAPANTEIICEIGGLSMLAGRSDYCNYPKEVLSVDSIGWYNAPNVEKIIGIKPDVIFAAEYMDDAVRQQLESAGMKVFVLKAASVDEVETDILKAARIMNKNPEAAETIADMEEGRAELTAVCQKIQTKKKVFIDLGEYYSGGDHSLMDSMLQEINAENIAAGTGSNVPQLSVEQIIKANPDVYISFYAKADEIKKVSGFDVLTAVKNNEVYAFDMLSEESDAMQRPGPRIVEGMKKLAETVYPEIKD